jgi:hypothetical protein
LPNLPLWPSGGTWLLTPGNLGYTLYITLACGSTNTTNANDVWQSGSFLGASGQDNFAALAANSVFSLAFVQHEPGAHCTTLIDKPFSANLDECLRYFQKTVGYGVNPGSPGANALGGIATMSVGTTCGGAMFSKRMAKAPNPINIYNASTGGLNSVWASGSSPTVTGVGLIGETSFQYVTLGSAPGTTLTYYHYTADTGW